MSLKWTLLIAACLMAASASASEEEFDDNALLEEDTSDVKPTARFAFVNLNSDGSLSFTFNATSLQYTLLAALTALVLAAILLPLLGLISVGQAEPDYGYAYTDQNGYTGPSYDVPAPAYGSGSSSYGGSSYHKRSMSWMGPVMEALSKAYRKYETKSDDREHDD